MPELTKEEIEAAARKGAEKAVAEAFAQLGFDMTSTQGRIEAQETFSFLRDWKSMCLLMRRQGVIGLTMAGISACVAATYFWARSGFPGGK